MTPTVAEIFREYADHDAERRSALMVAVLTGVVDDWESGGITHEVLEPYAGDPPGSALPLRFAAALHRLVLTGQAPELARHYPSVGGTAEPGDAWLPARRLLEQHTALVRALTGLPCQTNEVGRAVPLLVGLAEIAGRTGAPLRLLEIGASAGLNLLLDRFRFGSAWGPADSPCRLPDVGVPLATTTLRIAERAGCDPAPLDPGDPEARLRLSASIWGDQVDRLDRLRGALTVADTHRVPVERAGALAWLTAQLNGSPRTAVPVVWHSIVRSYVDPAEWAAVEELTSRAGIWRLAYEPDPGPNPHGIPLRLYGPDIRADGEVLAYGTAHGPPLSAA